MGMRIEPLEGFKPPIPIRDTVGSYGAFRYMQQARHFVARQPHSREIHRFHFPLDSGMGMMKTFLFEDLHVLCGNGQTYPRKGPLIPREWSSCLLSIDSTRQG